jgi:lysophospholipid acyltransferase
MKYYFGWSLAEGACILAGIGYNGVDKNGTKKWYDTINHQPSP